MTRIALCLAGGNALGAYHAGAVSHLLDRGHEIAHAAGTSIGAVVAGLIAGNPPERRVAALRAFCETAAQSSTGPVNPFTTRRADQRLSAVGTLLRGCPGLFGPSFPGLASIMPGIVPDVALFRRSQMRAELERLVDFDRLNGGAMRLSAPAIDVRSGEIEVFDTTRTRITVDHLLAATAFPGLFEPVTLDGRTFVDGALAMNLPVAPLCNGETLPIVAFDLFRMQGDAPGSLDAAAHRAQDIAFAHQGAQALRAAEGRTVLYKSYAHPEETALKTLDFSRPALRRRWEAGVQDAALVDAALSGLAADAGLVRLDPALQATS